MFVKTHSFDSIPSYITVSHTFSTPSDGLSLICFRFQISLRWPEFVGSNKLHTGVTWESLDSSPRASPLMSRHGPCSPVLVTQACTAGTVEDLHLMGWVLVSGKWWIPFSFSPLQDGWCQDEVYPVSLGMTQRDWQSHSGGQLNSGSYWPSLCPAPLPLPGTLASWECPF